MDGVLTGLRLAEVSAFVAAPLGACFLAGLGARVIRVEQLGGGIDAGRWPLSDGRSLYREGLDRGKHLVALDLQTESGQQLASKVICGGGEGGGILLTNLAVKGWLAYDRLAAIRPDLIMVVVKGTPQGGAAVDYTVNAGMGFPMITGPPEASEPVNHVLPAWDVATGALAATAILAAERRRRLTGQGGVVEIALSDVALEVARALGYLSEARLVPAPRKRYGNYLYGSYGRDFQTRDGNRVMVCALTPRQWQALTRAVAIEQDIAEMEARTGSDLHDEGERFRHREQISTLIEPWLSARSLAEVAAEFDAAGVLWGPYRSFKELLATDPSAGRPKESPLQFAGVPRARLRQPGGVGADTEMILRDELGLDEASLKKLRAAGVIAGETNVRE